MALLVTIHLLGLQFLISLSQLHVFSKADPINGPEVYSVKDFYPFVVLIVEISTEYHHKEHLCTGSLISKKQVLTAASCLENKLLQNLRIVSGIATESSYRHKSYSISSKKTYKDYENECAQNEVFKFQEIDDLCILGSDKEISRPIAISYQENFPTLGDRITLIGWGETRHGSKPAKAHNTHLEVLQKQECDKDATTFAPAYRKYLWANKVFCAQKSPAVKIMDGDFGGPAVHNGRLVGIAIRPRPFPLRVDVIGNQPILLLRLSNYKDFIQRYLH